MRQSNIVTAEEFTYKCGVVLCKPRKMNSKFRGQLLLLIGYLYLVQSKCVYESFNPKSPPVFTIVEINGVEKILNVQGSSIIIGEGSELTAFCSSNFSESLSDPDAFESPKYYDQIKIRCFENRLHYITRDGEKRNNIQKYPLLSCIQTVSLFRARTSFCEKQSFAYGLKTTIGDPEFFADVCFDLNTMETILVHYGTAVYTAMWQHPELYIYRDLPVTTDFLESSNERNKKLTDIMYAGWPKVLQSQKYRFDKLVPIQYLTKGNRVDHQLTLSNNILWWSNLKDGNWEVVERITEALTATRDFDVYTGVLYLNETDSFFDQILKDYLYYTLNSNILRIPLYVWKYIKPRFPVESNDEIVIIAINFPFLTGPEIHGLQFCQDECRQMYWLNDLLANQKHPAFGYVFCCKPNEARKKIEIIHKIQYAFRNTLEQEISEDLP